MRWDPQQTLPILFHTLISKVLSPEQILKSVRLDRPAIASDDDDAFHLVNAKYVAKLCETKTSYEIHDYPKHWRPPACWFVPGAEFW